MAALEVRMFFPSLVKKYLKDGNFSGTYSGDHFCKKLIIVKHVHTLMMVFSKEVLSYPVYTEEVYLNNKIAGNKVKIAGSGNYIFLLDSEGDLYQLVHKNKKELTGAFALGHKWILCEKFNFKQVFAIAGDSTWLACFGVENNGEKKIKYFETKNCKLKPDILELRIDEFGIKVANIFSLGTMCSCDNILLMLLRKSNEELDLVNYAFLEKIHCSDIPIVFVNKVTNSEFVLCYENGKIVNIGHDISMIFLRKKIKCIINCCSEICFLWSDGVSLHHTKINFRDGKVTYFQVEPNITGVISLMKFTSNSFIAVTINNTYYHVRINHCGYSKKIIGTPSEILSQIYNESLKINDIQKNLKAASEYLKFTEMIQKNLTQLELKQTEKFLIIKNLTGVTFEKEYWKIKCEISVQGLQQVKVVNLETDLVKGMTLQIQNPFGSYERVKVYLFCTFHWGIVRFLVGEVGERDDSRKEILKKRLDEIKLKKKYIEII